MLWMDAARTRRSRPRLPRVARFPRPTSLPAACLRHLLCTTPTSAIVILAMFHARHILAPVVMRSTIGMRRAHNPLSFRNFSASPTPQASESDAFIDRFRHTEMFKKLADKPEVLAALSEFAGKMRESGMSFAFCEWMHGD